LTPDLYVADQDPSSNGEHEETGQELKIAPSIDEYAVVGEEHRSRQQDEQVEKPPSLPVPGFLPGRASLRQEAGGQGGNGHPPLGRNQGEIQKLNAYPYELGIRDHGDRVPDNVEGVIREKFVSPQLNEEPNGKRVTARPPT
jgi:hypothetical protein